uniref:Uncharacterized protein n=1 Tax=Chromera velia CCMP2878 TaxID=1169474 RepID=A0A0G4GMW8_9ALVE|eukprot:Cvel_4931.t1-p1 / transcript=Cvel_4931.t1 / gene=Cvel_4931 / organism=Chromera_velia_CCMP2878 / gene_product=hypothetical protein / transcript_product=hypothetical protein / location=Cvel_scaffold223:4442-5492(-) / protein_length=169 / sequence_SO=supercontig / SO=protein_coding / is_pseudo=false
MEILCCRRLLRSSLFNRYGAVRQYECEIMRKKSFLPVCTKWAEVLVEAHPTTWRGRVDALRLPEAVVQSKEWQAAADEDVEVAWLLERLRLPPEEDCVPQPIFPSILRSRTPQWPYDPLELQRMTDFYGSLKWPFISKSIPIKRRGDFEGDDPDQAISTKGPTKPDPRG